MVGVSGTELQVQAQETFILILEEPCKNALISLLYNPFNEIEHLLEDSAYSMVYSLESIYKIDTDYNCGDIDIEFTGLRPAEKLYEELMIGENVSGTDHPRIMRAEEHFIPHQKLMPLLAEVHEAAQHLDRGRMREILKATVEEYQPALDIKDLLDLRGLLIYSVTLELKEVVCACLYVSRSFLN